MNSRYIKNALLNGRNILVLIAAFILALRFVPWPTGLSASTGALGLALLVYAIACAQNLLDPKFRERADREATISEIKALSVSCHAQERIMRRNLGLAGRERLTKVLADIDAIVHSYLGGTKTPIKTQVVQKSLKLADMYMRLIQLYQSRAGSVSADNIAAIAKRINQNTENLASTRDPDVANEIRRVIENDEKMIESLKGDRSELERIDARLQYMESTIGMLKYNIVSNLESEEALRTLDTELNEASAINTVLTERNEERRRERLRV